MNGEWFRILVSKKYQFNRDVQAAEESEIREAGFDWEVVHSAFCWKNLSKDFIREMVESDPIYKTQLEHQLLLDVHEYSVHASAFYQNMYIYLQLNLAEQKELKYYSEKVGQMYLNQLQQEQGSKQVYSLVDNTGKVLDSVVI